MKRINSFITVLLICTILSIYLSACIKTERQNNAVIKKNISLSKYFYKRLEGQIDNAGKIVMNLSRKDTLLTGNFYFKEKGHPVFFTYNSKIDSNNGVKLIEQSGKFDKQFKEIVQGVFTGEFTSNSMIEGTWSKPGTDIKEKFYLKEKYPAGSLKFTVKTATREYAGKNEGGAKIEYIFPQCDIISSSAVDSVNKKISSNLIEESSIGNHINHLRSFELEINNFIERFKVFESKPVFPKNYKPYWEDSFYSSILFNSMNIVVVENINFKYEGGAHPNTFYSFTNYNIRTGKVINLSDILNNGFKNQLDKIGEKIFRKTYGINPGEDLEKKGYFFENNKFSLNNNFAFFAGGLLFKFNQYEIAAYVYGAPEVFIPFPAIKNLLKNNGIISGFNK